MILPNFLTVEFIQSRQINDLFNFKPLAPTQFIYFICNLDISPLSSMSYIFIINELTPILKLLVSVRSNTVWHY